MRNILLYLALSIQLLLMAGCFKSAVCSRCLQPTHDYIVQEEKPTTDTTAKTPSTSIEKGRETPIVRVLLENKDLIAYAIISVLSIIIVSKTGATPKSLSQLSTYIYDKCSASKKKILTIFNAIVRRKR